MSIQELHIGWTLGLPRLPQNNDERFAWMQQVLKRVRYASLSRDAKMMVRNYLEARTGYERQNVLFATLNLKPEPPLEVLHTVKTVGVAACFALLLFAPVMQ